MANPRDVVDFKDIGQVRATFKADSSITFDSTLASGTAHVGKAVKMVADDQVGLATDATHIVGVISHQEADGKVVVIVSGFVVTLRDSGTALTVGSPVVGGLSSSNPGYVRAGAASAAEALVARGTAIRTTTATAVIVRL